MSCQDKKRSQENSTLQAAGHWGSPGGPSPSPACRPMGTNGHPLPGLLMAKQMLGANQDRKRAEAAEAKLEQVQPPPTALLPPSLPTQRERDALEQEHNNLEGQLAGLAASLEELTAAAVDKERARGATAAQLAALQREHASLRALLASLEQRDSETVEQLAAAERAVAALEQERDAALAGKGAALAERDATAQTAARTAAEAQRAIEAEGLAGELAAQLEACQRQLAAAAAALEAARSEAAALKAEAGEAAAQLALAQAGKAARAEALAAEAAHALAAAPPSGAVPAPRHWPRFRAIWARCYGEPAVTEWASQREPA
ncbi:hypothetical protein COHA_001702 [Chlorella ohadii]|uniref:Uncharacterized protein n=1 Tax=Chlorella ohadii TaxID=2649997 RepID=A0AAD5DYB5_9CHLO|nr:hypothetical protein COHA_001702 [Chlorella ohadii]